MTARARARRAMTVSLAAEALELFEQNGYDATSIEDVCDRAEISKTTFFRYFESKEGALMGSLADVDLVLAPAFASAPADASVWFALRVALDAIVEAYTRDADRTLRVLHVFGATPSLGSFHHGKVDRWIQLLEPEARRRLGHDDLDPQDPRPAAVLGAGFACLDAALGAWARSDRGHRLQDLLDQATESVQTRG